MADKMNKTDDEWREMLTPEQYRVAREAGTEPAFSGEYCDTKTDGVVRVAVDDELGLGGQRQERQHVTAGQRRHERFLRIDEIRAVMRGRRIRHIPVLDGKRVMGMISIGDLNKADHEGQAETIKYLEQFMSVT